MFYEDVDLGWRLNLLGWRVRYVPDVGGLPQHHASMKKFGAFRENYLLERNALLQHVQELRRRVAGPGAAGGDAAGGAPRRSRAATSTPPMLDLQRAAGRRRRRRRSTVAEDGAGRVVRHRLLRRAAAVARRGPPAAAGRSAGAATASCCRCSARRWSRRTPHPALPGGHEVLVEAFGIERALHARRRILVVTGEPLSAAHGRPGDPGLGDRRAPCPPSTTSSCVTTGTLQRSPAPASRPLGRPGASCGELERLVRRHHLPGPSCSTSPLAQRQRQGHRRRHLRPDAPRAARAGQGPGRRAAGPRRSSDCDARAQRAAAPGRLLPVRVARSSATSGSASSPASGRINPHDLRRGRDAGRRCSPWCRSACPTSRRCRRGTALKGVVPGIGADDKVILWGGGIYNWFDPLTLIRAVDRLRQRRPGRAAVLPRHASTRTPTCPRCGWPSRAARARPTQLGPDRQARVLQRGLGAVRRAAELPARRRRRRQHPLRPRRDRVLLPHPDPRLPVGRRCRSSPPAATPSPT